MQFLRKTLLLLGLGLSFSLFAQKKDKAKEILDVVSTHYKSKNNVFFQFTYTTGSGKSAKNQTGEFYASKDKYRFKIPNNTQIFDGNKIYNINEEDQEITIAKPSANDNFLSPISYLESYKKGYQITHVGKKGSQDIIKLVPNKNNGVQQILLYINFSKKQVEKVEQVFSNNAKNIVNITQYKENITLQSNLFSFNKNSYKNYLITEL